LDASSGDQNRHRLSRAGNRRINRTLQIMAVVQLRNDTCHPLRPLHNPADNELTCGDIGPFSAGRSR
jgi:hypothetical protein